MSTTPVTPKAMHQWAAGGVSGYPVKHPLIGQGDFFNKFQHFLRLTTDEEFVQVFAAIAAWGVGKSSLGFQVISQINAADNRLKQVGMPQTGPRSRDSNPQMPPRKPMSDMIKFCAEVPLLASI